MAPGVKSPALAAASISAAVAVLWLVGRRQGIRKRGLLCLSRNHDDLVLEQKANEDDNTDADADPCIYLDYNGTTPVYPQVLKAMMPYWTKHFGNPSSGHVYGEAPAAAVAHARQQILRELLGVVNANDADANADNAIVFTACGTEADNLAIHWALLQHQQQQPQQDDAGVVPHIVTSNVEHPAIEQYLQAHTAAGKVQVTYVPVGRDGRVTYQDMVDAIQSNT